MVIRVGGQQNIHDEIHTHTHIHHNALFNKSLILIRKHIPMIFVSFYTHHIVIILVFFANLFRVVHIIRKRNQIY